MEEGFFELPDTLLCAVDFDGDVQRVSRAWQDMLGFSRGELEGAPFLDLIHPEERDNVAQYLAATDGVVRPVQLSARLLTGGGLYRQFDWSILRSEPERRVLISARESGRAGEVLPETYRDGLTGLPNRALLLYRVEHAIERTKRRDEFRFAVLYLGIDRFKVVNDSLGHRMGDMLLAGVARTIENTVRPTDTVSRMAGDEFAVILDDIEDVSSTLRVVNRLSEKMSVPFKLGEHEVFTDVSIGIAVHHPEHQQADQIIRDANTAMYRAKEQGGAGYVVFDPRMHEEAVARLELEMDLRRAVERDEFEAYYQPIIDLRSGRLNGFEALVRWNHPEKGLIPPGRFIPLAETTGMVVPIGRWVLHEACRQLADWQREFRTDTPVTMSVNLSAKQLRDERFGDEVAEILDDTGIDPRCLKLEITESAVMEDSERALRLLHRLKAMSVQLCLDDFGTGYSSLSYLHQLPVDILKIDRSFINKIGETARNGNFVASIVQLSHSLDLEVVSEGIETAGQEALLKTMDVEYGQGFYYSRPVAAGEARVLMVHAAAGRRLAPENTG